MRKREGRVMAVKEKRERRFRRDPKEASDVCPVDQSLSETWKLREFREFGTFGKGEVFES